MALFHSKRIKCSRTKRDNLTKKIIKKPLIFIFQILIVCITLQPDYLLAKESIVDVFHPISLQTLYTTFDEHYEEQEELNEMFRVQKIYNPIGNSHKKVVSFSLFWKAPYPDEFAPVITEYSVFNEIVQFSRKKCSFYEKYVSPMVQNIQRHHELHPNWVFRIYLASDLEFLVPKILEPHIEIYLMSSSSIYHNPGAMWRFLVFDDLDVDFVSIQDTDDNINDYMLEKIVAWLDDPLTKGWFRFLDFKYREPSYTALYSPITASCFGGKNIHHINMEKAMKGFILYRKLYLEEARHPRDLSFARHPYGQGNSFPIYGFDERFLKHVIYYEAAVKGELIAMSLTQNFADTAIHDIYCGDEEALVFMDWEFVKMYNPLPLYK